MRVERKILAFILALTLIITGFANYPSFVRAEGDGEDGGTYSLGESRDGEIPGGATQNIDALGLSMPFAYGLNEVTVTTLPDLRAALESTGTKTVIIDEDIAITGNMIELPSGADITLQASGSHTISGGTSNGAILVKSGAALTIADDNLTFTNSSGYFFDVLEPWK